MFWNRLFSTLKMRMALSYALLFFLSCGTIFMLLAWGITGFWHDQTEAALRDIADNVEAMYVMGSHFVRMSDLQPGSAYPEKSRQKLCEKFPDCRVLYVLRPRSSNADADSFSTAFVQSGGSFYEMRLLPDGGLYSRQLNVRNNLESLRHYFALLSYSRGSDRLYLEVQNPDGSEVLHSPGRHGGPNWRYHRYTLPDGKLLVIARSEQQTISARNYYMHNFLLLLGAVTVCGGVIGWLLARRFIAGLKEINTAVGRIAQGDYAYRIEPEATANDREIRELMQQINDMNARTEALVRELKLVSGNVAHDLRTPLTRISGTLEMLLRDRTLPEQVLTGCAGSIEEIGRLKALINTIMDISSTTFNPDALHKENLDLCEAVRRFCEIVYPAAEEKGLEFRVIVPETPVRIEADKLKLERLISNLGENALKFTSSGFIEFRVSVTGNQAELMVSDSGCGIAYADQKHVFDRFFRSDFSRNLPGNGLGLSLVQAVVRAHHWELHLQSSPGIGSSFAVTIPVAEQ